MYSSYLKEVFDVRDIERCKRRIHLLVLHCSATRVGQDYGPESLLSDHLRRGFRHAGYHYYVTVDGRLFALRPLEEVGAHVRGIISTLSGSVMRVVLMLLGKRQIHALKRRVRHF